MSELGHGRLRQQARQLVELEVALQRVRVDPSPARLPALSIPLSWPACGNCESVNPILPELIDLFFDAITAISGH
jgi:hypothetical protein